MTITELFKRLEQKGYDNIHARHYFIGCIEPKYREPDRGQDWWEHHLTKELEIDRRQVFKVWYADSFSHGKRELEDAHRQYEFGNINFAVDFIREHP